jgi:small conductance mechanosensitive channel
MTWIDKVKELLVVYGFKLAGAAAVVLIGFVIAGYVGRFLNAWLMKFELQPPVRNLGVRLARLVVIVLAVIIALPMLGVEMTPLIAGLGVAGVGVGLAMQGLLGDIVAGLTIIFTKPFIVGHYIRVIGEFGEVIDIALFRTTLRHEDESRIVIPNRKIAGEVLHNYGSIRQHQLSVGVAYGSDLRRVIAAAKGVLAGNPRVLKEPAARVGVSSLGDSAIVVAVKPWTKVTDYEAAGPELYFGILEAFRAEGIVIPYPQREVRLLGGDGGPGEGESAKLRA